MLISYNRPVDITSSLSGAGAAWLSDDAGAALFNGRPASVSRIQWLSGGQTTASQLTLQASWGAAIVPRVLGIVGLTLPVGTLIEKRGQVDFPPRSANTPTLETMIC